VTSQGTNAPLQGVRVLLSSPSMLGTRQTVTDADGRFRFALLPNGECTITYSLDGYLSRRLTMHLTAGQTINGSIRLEPQNIQEAVVEISSTNQAAFVDKMDTVSQTAFSSTFLSQIMATNNLRDLANLIPGISSPDGGLESAQLRVRGGTGQSTKTYENGQNVTEQFGGYSWGNSKPLQDLIESVAVIQSPQNARYGNSDGGIVSLVTAKGSNEFKGSYRVQGLNRDFWSAIDRGYPRRDGTSNSVDPTPDNLNKEMEFTLQGPIWKDHITFTYGGKIQPLTTTSKTWNSNVNSPPRRVWNNPDLGPRPNDFAGTYYETPNGIVIRRAELRNLQNPYNRYPIRYKSSYNHFSLFAQINPNHQFEYSYREESFKEETAFGWMAELIDSCYGENKRNWTLAYKGIIGANGVLDIRTGRQYNYWEDGAMGQTMHKVYLIPSVVPISGTYDRDENWRIGNYSNNDPSNFVSNGFIDAALNGVNDNSIDYLFGDTESNSPNGGGPVSTQLNYQHYLNAMGVHIIDVGMQDDRLEWQLAKANPLKMFIPGQIASDLRLIDVYNPGNVNLNLSNYQGKYIVFNVNAATIGDLDPTGYALNRYKLTNPTTPFTSSTPVNNGTTAFISAFGNLRPRLERRWGGESGATGEYSTQQRSFYINDMWSINDYHSVMFGVRVDMFKVWDSARDIHSYTKPTFRFNYKWDIQGDQSRLLSASLCQFHNYQNGALFARFTTHAQPFTERMFWNTNDPSTGQPIPYLVGYDELTNMSNWSIYSTTNNASDSTQIDPNWKSPTATEFTIGFARNLTNGGNWKITFVSRTWADQWDIFPGELYAVPNSVTDPSDYMKQQKTLLKNSDEYKRVYTGVEFEWDIPVTKRLLFGGNYTYARLMSNETEYGSQMVQIREGTDQLRYAMPAFWDEQFGSRDVWNPVRLSNSEHYFKFFLVYDLSLGNSKSSVSFQGQFISASQGTDSFVYRTGYPIIFGVNEYNGGGTFSTANPSVIVNVNGLEQQRSIPFNIYTGNDSWGLNMRYNLEVPLGRGLAWFLTADVSNPFNHRGIAAKVGDTHWFNPGGPNDSGRINVNDLTASDGTVTPKSQNPLGPYNGVWRTDGNINELYRTFMSPRSVTLQTGLRF
jgi:hypothetical protein